MDRPICGPESSWIKCTPLTVTSVWSGQVRQNWSWAPVRMLPGSALTRSLGRPGVTDSQCEYPVHAPSVRLHEFGTLLNVQHGGTGLQCLDRSLAAVMSTKMTKAAMRSESTNIAGWRARAASTAAGSNPSAAHPAKTYRHALMKVVMLVSLSAAAGAG